MSKNKRTKSRFQREQIEVKIVEDKRKKERKKERKKRKKEPTHVYMCVCQLACGKQLLGFNLQKLRAQNSKCELQQTEQEKRTVPDKQTNRQKHR